MSRSKLAEVIEIVTAWRNGADTEIAAARHMYDLAVLLEIPPAPGFAGKVTRTKPKTVTASNRDPLPKKARRISAAAYTSDPQPKEDPQP